jgi:acyl-CoA hydrolase
MDNKTLKMSFLAQTTDANYHGNVHGGKVMKWIDEVAYALAVRYARKNCVTRFVDDIAFSEAIHIGDLVYLTAELIKVGNTSMRIHVEVSSENLIEQLKKDNCACDIVFVAIDKNGKKTTIK